ncbi:WecB/TagA/CpsF family glycosyltransferase [Patescibacteria group bacterium]|nr:WecB/TagA/CpsF family glycosyltransferase [Patescibacteria group bacterium]
MGLKTKKILDVAITVQEKDEILEEIKKYLSKSQIPNPKSQNKMVNPLVIFTPNPEIINFAQKNIFFKEVVNSAQINIPDGAGIVWALKKKENMSIDKISGADFILDLCKLTDKKGFTIGLIGGKNGVALKTSECLRKKYKKSKIEVLGEPDILVVSSKCYVTSKSDKLHITNDILYSTKEKSEKKTEKYFENLVKEIIKRRIDTLFVALGFPKQEYFIENVKHQMLNVKTTKPLVLMAVGGAFDYISGSVPRAPFWMRRIGLEWLFRLIREPWRIKRQTAGAGFFFRVLFS